EVVEAMTPEGHPLPRLYRLLAAYLDRLEKEPAAAEDRRFFEINLLNILGYRPSLESCSRCNALFGTAGALLQESGEPVCRACAATGSPLHPSTLKALNACMATGTFGKVVFTPDLLAEGGVLLDRSIATHAGRRLNSLEFLGQVTH
ncbi:MAG: DNA repair protein RecO, partial [Oryzomonas sp.]